MIFSLSFYSSFFFLSLFLSILKFFTSFFLNPFLLSVKYLLKCFSTFCDKDQAMLLLASNKAERDRMRRVLRFYHSVGGRGGDDSNGSDGNDDSNGRQWCGETLSRRPGRQRKPTGRYRLSRWQTGRSLFLRQMVCALP